MRKTLNSSSKKYLREIKFLLPTRGRSERTLFYNISLRLSELNTLDSDVTYEKICNELGFPQEIVTNYFYNTDIRYLSQRIRFSHYIKRTMCTILILLLIISGYRIYSLNKAYQMVANTIVTHEIEVIE